ncbi:MAG: response regulator [Planctomycetota bacterium]
MAKQILIIDDDQNSVKFLSVVLSEHGYESVSAPDGVEGMKQVERAKPDLIILDVMMPKKSGFVLFKQLKEDAKYRCIPILMVTGASAILEELGVRERAPADKPYDSLREALKGKLQEIREEGQITPEMFMDKPIDPDAFIAKVRNLIGD